MAVGSTGILKYFRPVGSSSSSTTPTLPDPDGPLSERVPAKAIELANNAVKQSKESSRGRRPPRGCCSLHYKGKLYKNTLGVKKRGQVGSTSYFYFLHATKRCDIR